MQKHAASRLHFDFRLELDGVLKSWAIPKGPSLDPKNKTLAIQVEDHPLEYGDFEGIIPKQQYGGGTVMIWDRGTWEPIEDLSETLPKGQIKFRLHGDRLRGDFALVQIRGANENGKSWLLIKKKDAYAKEQDLRKEFVRSVVSGRTMDEIAADSDRVWSSQAGEVRGSFDFDPPAEAQRKKQPKKLKPMAPTIVDSVPEGDDWLHEIVYAGQRLLCFKDRESVRLVTDKGQDWTDQSPRLLRAVEQLPVRQVVLDGVAVVFRENGAPDPDGPGKHASSQHVFVVFDMLHCEGFDLTGVGLFERKQLLAKLCSVFSGQAMRFGDHMLGNGTTFYEEACRVGLPGIVSKKTDGKYSSRSKKTWVTVSC